MWHYKVMTSHYIIRKLLFGILFEISVNWIQVNRSFTEDLCLVYFWSYPYDSTFILCGSLVHHILARFFSFSSWQHFLLIGVFVTMLAIVSYAQYYQADVNGFHLMPPPFFRGHKQHLVTELSKKARFVEHTAAWYCTFLRKVFWK